MIALIIGDTFYHFWYSLLAPTFCCPQISVACCPLATAVVTFTMCLCFDTLGALICIAEAGDLLNGMGGLGCYSRGMTAVALSIAVTPLLGTPPIGIPVEGSTGATDGIGVSLISYTAISLVSGKGKTISPVTHLLPLRFVAMYVLSAI